MQKNKKMDQRGESHVDRKHQFKTIDQVRFAALYALDVAQNDGHPLLEAPKEGWTIEQQRIIQGLAPVLSLDSMAKLPVGKFARAGQRLRPVGQPLHVNDHDFCDNKVTPYAIFDIIGRNFGMIFLGHHATAEFAVDNLERWWLNYGKKQYSEAKTIHLLMDCGGSNSYRSRVFKLRLARFVEGKNFKIEAHHYPPRTSKYNPIEHRMFPHCSRALQGQILLSEQCIQELLSDAKTNVGSLGLRVKAFIVDKEYCLGLKVPDCDFAKINVIYKAPTGAQLPQESSKWNYSIYGIV